MDTTGFNQVGRYGTLSLLKRRTPATAQGDELVTSFGIDANDLTFGSSSTCGVRLYYPDVDAVHCKIMFEDRKAFLVIYGSEGVYVDGSWVHPETPSGPSDSAQPQVIVPLSNNSEFEIHNKRFKFTYPPKELRAAVMDTPAPVGKRTLRLSMIHSAQVFSPRPSQDPRENLKVLQSPLKGIFGVKTPQRPGQTPTRPRAVSPLKYGVSRPDSDEDSDDEAEAEESREKAADSSGESEDENEDEEQIVLVETNHPRVVEEERDLVILEHVTTSSASPPPPSPARALQQVKSMPQNQVQNPAAPPQTPRRKSMSGTALHRAVLIRSAQRAVWRAEREREDEEEEMEVMGAVEVDDDDDEEELADQEDNDVEMRSVSSDEVSDPEMEDEEQDPKTVAEQKSLWRKSIERIIPWTLSGSPAKQEEEQEDEDEQAEEPEASQEVQDEEEAEVDDETNDIQADEHIQEDEEEQEEEAVAPLSPPPVQTPIRRILGSFMTPQPQPQDAAAKRNNIFPQTVARPSSGASSSATTTASDTGTGLGRLSLGGGEARRVMVQQPWKVKDLVVPPIPTASKGTPGPFGASSTTVSPVRRLSEAPPVTPMRGARIGAGTVGTSTSTTTFAAPRATPVVTEEERRAIQERRRSAVRDFKEDGFWKDGAPGMSPAKSGERGIGSSDIRSLSTSPVKMGSMGAPINRPSSPTKGRTLVYAIAEEEGDTSMSTPYKEPKASALAAAAVKQPSRGRSKSSDRGERDDRDEDEEAQDKEDTQFLLENMRRTVEDLKRRRSIVPTPRIGNTPLATAAGTSDTLRPSVAALPSFSSGAASTSTASLVSSSVALATPHRPSNGGINMPYRIGNVKKIDFSHIAPTASSSLRRGKSPARPLEDMTDIDLTSEVQPAGEPEVEEGDDEPFSLLRPGAQDLHTPVAPTRRLRDGNESMLDVGSERVRHMSVIEEPSNDDDDMDEDIEVRKPKPRGRPRAPQTPKVPEVSTEEQAEVSEPTPAKSKPAKPAPKPRSKAAKSPAPEATAETSTLAPPVRRGRSKTPQPVQVEEEVEEPAQPKRSASGKRTRRGTAEPEETLAPPPSRRGKSKTPQPVHDEEDVEEEDLPKRNTAGSRLARRGTAELQERVTAATGPARRVRKAVVEAEEEEAPAPEPEVKESKTPAVKRGRKPKVAPTATEDEEAEDAPVPVAAPAKRSRSRKAVASTDDHSDTDPVQPVASGSKTKSSIPIKATVKGRKKVVTHEEEDDREDEEEPTPLARGRGAKGNIALPKVSTVTKTPAAAVPTANKLAKPRGRPKTPATAPAATTSRTASSSTVPAGKSEKENTPGAGSNSIASDDAEEQPVKVRVSRKTAAAATAATGTTKPSRIATKSATKAAATKSASRTKAQLEVNDEQEDEAPAASSKPRATRVMRARTKTG